MKRLAGLQVLRAVAALMVVLQHAYYFSGQVVGDDVLAFRLLQVGTLGVILFFVISGVVMAAVAGEHPAGRFALSRILRIYPPYFVALGVGAALLIGSGTGAPSWDGDLSLFLLPTGTLNGSFQVAYWPLIYGVAIYAVLFFLALLRIPLVLKAWLAVLWAIGILVAARLAGPVPLTTPDVTQVLVAPMNLYFIAGYTLGVAIARRDPKPLAALLVVLGAAVQYFGVGVETVNLAWIVGFSAIAALFAAIRGWPSILVRLGDWSYGIYLVNLPVIFVIYFYASQLGWSFAMSLGAMLTAGLIAGALFGWVECATYSHLWRRIANRIGGEPVDGSLRPAEPPSGWEESFEDQLRDGALAGPASPPALFPLRRG